MNCPEFDAVAGEASAVREKLGNRRLRDLRVQFLDILPDRVVQPQLARFTQLHYPG